MNNKQRNEELSFPVMEERASIDKEIVEQAKVRIIKKVHEEEEHIDLVSKQEEVEVHKIVINKFVDEAPAVRYEGDTMIVPVLKEVVVKRLLLAEEIHVTKHTVETRENKIVPLLREEVQIERVTRDDIKEKP